MPGHCAVVNCNKKGGHRFPKDKVTRKRWIMAVNRKNWKPTDASIVCYSHFTEDDYVKEGYFSGLHICRKKLKKGAVPSVFWYKPAPTSETSDREMRYNSRSATVPVPHIEIDNEGNHCSNIMQPLKNVKSSIEYSSIQDDVAPLSPPCQDFDDDDQMQKVSIIRPPNMLCTIYSLPDANPVEFVDVQNDVVSSESCADNNTQNTLPEQDNLDLNLDTTEDMESFYSRCLLCTCRPDATPHIEIFSDAGNQLYLAEKLDSYLNVKIEPGLPQRVCRICVEKLEVTYELVTSSKRAKNMLLHIKQQIRKRNMGVTPFEHVDIQQTQPFQIKVEPDNMDFNTSELCPELDSCLPAGDTVVINKDISNDINADEIPMEDSTNSLNHSNEKPTSTADTEQGVAVKPKGSKWEDETDGPCELDFIPCSRCPEVIYKGYMEFHMKLCHGDLKPVERKKADERTKEQKLEDRRRTMLLELIECGLCKKHLYSQVLDLHVLLRHKEQTEDLPETSRLMQCPSCPCMFFPEYMQGHIAEEHPPAQNSILNLRKECIYCNCMICYCDMDQHLDSEHGLNTWKNCIHCKKKVRNTDTDMEAHLFQEHPGGKLLVCKVCDIGYSKTGKEQAHMQTFHSCKYKCPLQTCGKTFVTFTSFKDHVLFFHPKIEEDLQDEIKKETEDFLASVRKVEKPADDKNSKTTEAQKNSDPLKMTNIQQIPSQLRQNDYGGQVDCDICKVTVRHKWCLIKHKKEVHNMNLSFDCPDCGKKFQVMHGILEHIHRSHMPKDQICEICGETFTKRKIWTHMKWHKKYPHGTPQRNFLDRPLDPVRCGMCNRPARNKYALLTHINAEHLDVVKERLRFHCEPCDKEFVTYEYLMQHNYSKHLPKIVCIYCGKLVTQNRMSMHLKIHEPDRGSDYKGRKRGRKPTRKVSDS